MSLYDKEADLEYEYRKRLPDATGRLEESATEMLAAWVQRDTFNRSVTRIALQSGTNRWVVEIRGKSGAHESTTQLTLDSAVRTVLMTASWGGDK